MQADKILTVEKCIGLIDGDAVGGRPVLYCKCRISQICTGLHF